jgi:hypothetical protein
VSKGDGLRNDDPLFQAMKAIIWSSEGQQAALDATNAGRPAVCGVDPLLQTALGREYRHIAPANTGPRLPLEVGSQVAMVMRQLGYTESGRGVCPKECVIKSGQKWKPKD